MLPVKISCGAAAATGVCPRICPAPLAPALLVPNAADGLMAKGRPATKITFSVCLTSRLQAQIDIVCGTKEIVVPGQGHIDTVSAIPERPVRSGFVSKPAPPVRSGTDRKTSVSPAFVVAKFAVGIETVGMDTFGMVSTDETGDCVLVPDSMTS